MASESVSKNDKIQTAHFACCQNFFMLINSLNDTKNIDNNKHPIEVIECLIKSLVNWFEVYGKTASKQTDLMGKNKNSSNKIS